MALHLIKLCVGATSIEDLASWQAANRQHWHKVNGRDCVYHTTFQTPKRREDILGGGSLYWVIKGIVQARQRLVGLEEGRKADGSNCCLLLLDPEIVPVKPVPRRAFQGWRYLSAEDAPTDLPSGDPGGLGDLPAKLRRELAELCLI